MKEFRYVVLNQEDKIIFSNEEHPFNITNAYYFGSPHLLVALEDSYNYYRKTGKYSRVEEYEITAIPSRTNNTIGGTPTPSIF